MGTLNKYILKQVAGAAFLTVALFVFVLVLGNVMKEVVGDLAAGRLSMGFFLYIVALLIPGVKVFSAEERHCLSAAFTVLSGIVERR